MFKNSKDVVSVAGGVLFLAAWLKPFLQIIGLLFKFIISRFRLLLFIAYLFYLGYPYIKNLFIDEPVLVKFVKKFYGDVESTIYYFNQKYSDWVNNLITSIQNYVPVWFFSVTKIGIIFILYGIPLFVFFNILRRIIIKILLYIKLRQEYLDKKQQELTYGFVSEDKDGEILITNDRNKIREILKNRQDVADETRNSIIPLAALIGVFCKNLQNISFNL